MGPPWRMRPTGVWHPHMQSASISELEVFDRWPGMRVQHETDALVGAGYVERRPDGSYALTPKGIAERDKERSVGKQPKKKSAADESTPSPRE
jgi:hypothetical protein